ncbi:Molecular chaperone (DnaJ superfamily) [Handroanthus impetiginosus]|uniref:Molecular chaperone (DnaJ superfamily) n=1 Tax=Handroanthus impetiginosus TaxID=429701 RepID=A0A2G9H6Y3_9LAMI|nr:Molecular chaperone (DnaJ superfamily) [Handroanthus impetiginosus]
MSRVRWLASSPKSVFQKFLFQDTISVQSPNGVLCRKVSQFQRALIHSPTKYRYSYMGKHVDFAPYELLSSKRFVHATGALRSVERDYYEILGLAEDATRDEIKKAFHALAKKYHPDANKNNPTAKRKFQEIRDAYETLQDPETRAQYDRMRENSARAKNAEYPNRDWDDFRYANRTQFSDTFHKIFSEIFESETDGLAGDIQVELVLTFSEAARGCSKHLSFDADVPCDSCHGRGHPVDAQTKLCPTCQGIGRVTIPPFTTTCSTCKGFGQIIKEHCLACKGSGVCQGVRDVKVTIPAGVDSGDTIHVPKAGNSGGWGRSPGNLFIKLKVAEDSIFSRQGADLYVDSYISFTQAILGGRVEVPTLSGKMQLQIPRGVQHGQLVVLRGKGLPRSGFLVDHGDQYVRFCIKFPSTVTEKQRAILEEFEKEIIDQNSTFAEDSWWQNWIERTIGPKLILELSILMLIFLFLGKVLN